MKQLMLQTDVDDKIITTTKTKFKDVIGEMDMVLAVGKNSRKAYLVIWNGGGAELINPEFWGVRGKPFDTLWELQHFFDIYLFKSLTELDDYVQRNELAWGDGGN